MNRGAKLLAAAAAVSAAGCNQDEVNVRAIPAPVSAVAKPVPARIAEARGQLVLGNAALALESFRKALRDDPRSIDALAGIAASYERMGRFDLSGRYYESALALAPGDTTLLAALASSLERQGLKAEALAVRREVQLRIAAAAQKPTLKAATAAAPNNLPETASARPPVPQPRPQSQPERSWTVAGADAPGLGSGRAIEMRPAPIVGRSVSFALPPARPAAPVVAAAPPRAPVPAPQPQLVAAAAAPEAPAEAVLRPADEVANVPATRPLDAPAFASAAAGPIAVKPPSLLHAFAGFIAEPTAAAPVPAAALEFPKPADAFAGAAASPKPVKAKPTRLERLSLVEVALITTAQPLWRAKVVDRDQRSATVRFVPLRTAEVRRPNVRLLNAARYQGLAARTRSYLLDRGWREIAIGDAPRVRQNTVILYPESRRATARRLAVQFGFRVEARASGSEMIVLLGRDAARGVPATSEA